MIENSVLNVDYFCFQYSSGNVQFLLFFSMAVFTFMPLRRPVCPANAPISSAVPSKTSDMMLIFRSCKGMPCRPIIRCEKSEIILFIRLILSLLSMSINVVAIRFSVGISVGSGLIKSSLSKINPAL